MESHMQRLCSGLPGVRLVFVSSSTLVECASAAIVEWLSVRPVDEGSSIPESIVTLGILETRCSEGWRRLATKQIVRLCGKKLLCVGVVERSWRSCYWRHGGGALCSSVERLVHCFHQLIHFLLHYLPELLWGSVPCRSSRLYLYY